ncbi:MAG: type II toxin-antitoxin system VapC family toxin [Acidobacteria bacterium]|nr:type II toxin-antitoxin system VapC family toxin [Acidobacteriota bacterium]
MTVYLAPSALIKLYVDELGSADVATMVDKAAVVATCATAYPELCAVIAERQRAQTLTEAQATRALAQIDHDWATLLIVVADTTLLQRAGQLTRTHDVAGADAIHLAAFERLMNAATDDDLQFACADPRLTAAADALL